MHQQHRRRLNHDELQTQTIVATTIALTASIAIALIPTKPDASTAVLVFIAAIAIIFAARFAYLHFSSSDPIAN